MIRSVHSQSTVELERRAPMVAPCQLRLSAALRDHQFQQSASSAVAAAAAAATAARASQPASGQRRERSHAPKTIPHRTAESHS